MIVMVLLRIISDGALFMMAAGPAAVHFGASPVQMIVTFLVIAAAQTVSYVICKARKRDRRPEGAFPAGLLRLAPFAAPFLCVLLPGRCISWAIVCGLFWAYAVYLAVTENYVPDADHQKKVFKATAAVCVVALIVLLIVSAGEQSFTICILSCFISLGTSALLLRSLRHEPEVYNSPSFQLINTGIMAVFAGAVIGLSQRSVIGAVLSGIKTVYLAVARGLLYAVMFVIQGIQKLIEWLAELLKFRPHSLPPQPVQDITMQSTVFDDIEPQGLPKGVEIGLIVFGAILAAAILFAIFRALAGRRGNYQDEESGKERSFRAGPGAERRKDRSPGQQVKGVRRQYRKYLHYLKEQGVDIAAYQTSEDIETSVPEELRNESAAQLRSLYLKARYNGEVDEDAHQRAKELVHMIKAGRAG